MTVGGWAIFVLLFVKLKGNASVLGQCRVAGILQRCLRFSSDIGGRKLQQPQTKENVMLVQFLLFLVAVLFFVVFWELCKITNQLKRILDSSAKVPVEGRHSDVAITPKIVG